MDNNFDTHKATLVLHQDNLYLIDFRREDGSSNYYIRFFVDTSRSSVHIEGDLGECISIWYNSNSIERISEMMLNVSYWIGKFCCSSDKYVYNFTDAQNELEHDTYEALEDMDPESYAERIEAIMGTFNHNYGLMLDTEESRDSLSELCGSDAIYCWDMHKYGRKIDDRCYLWATAFDLALKQLGLKPNGMK